MLVGVVQIIGIGSAARGRVGSGLGLISSKVASGVSDLRVGTLFAFQERGPVGVRVASGASAARGSLPGERDCAPQARLEPEQKVLTSFRRAMCYDG